MLAVNCQNNECPLGKGCSPDLPQSHVIACGASPFLPPAYEPTPRHPSFPLMDPKPTRSVPFKLYLEFDCRRSVSSGIAGINLQDQIRTSSREFDQRQNQTDDVTFISPAR
ncbi:hypothetical protein J6590_054859 [Homalodisca vitripennis]|nr:hypothetical protein J6590_054859 [Homalodisca vitripennis]